MYIQCSTKTENYTFKKKSWFWMFPIHFVIIWLYTCTDLFWASYDRGGVDCFIMQWKLDIKISDITNCFSGPNYIISCFLRFIDYWYNKISDITNKISRSQCSRYVPCFHCNLYKTGCYISFTTCLFWVNKLQI